MIVKVRLSAALLFAVASAAVLVVAGQASAANPLTATFTIHFPKGHPASNAPCDPQEFCGVGTVAGYGAATITILDETFDEIPDSACFAVTRVEEIALLDASGTLVLESSGTFCRPGGSGDSNAGPSSYGAPGRWDLQFTIDGADSTGIFQGVSGTGTETMGANGGVGVWHINGG
jgi:hypothetical protein